MNDANLGGLELALDMVDHRLECGGTGRLVRTFFDAVLGEPLGLQARVAVHRNDHAVLDADMGVHRLLVLVGEVDRFTLEVLAEYLTLDRCLRIDADDAGFIDGVTGPHLHADQARAETPDAELEIFCHVRRSYFGRSTAIKYISKNILCQIFDEKRKTESFEYKKKSHYVNSPATASIQRCYIYNTSISVTFLEAKA